MTGRVVPIRPSIAEVARDRPAFDPKLRGYSMCYRVGQAVVPECPGCGRQQWIVGRSMAECAFCSTALPIAR